MDTVTPDQFYKHLDDVMAGMLGAGNAAAVPMSHYVERDTNTLFFITARQTDLAQASRSPAEAVYMLADPKANLWARIHGTLTAVTDPAHLDEFWGRVPAAWFEGGKDDPDVQLLRLDLREAEVWATDGGAKFLFEIARANVTGAKPDVGDHGHIRF
ncbi:pyridoxamine 5'-phosphate oxidase family protein [Wenxinia saemankumensis]|uniref:General stress protein 26 n=1 Tax=Wenxinia saemankumensis TaxID=1447782 RepID=A0A1M6AZK7_9RHOB|nr:pyridoxamine 5'-phosphate oxidase family protein [Wenxinia saemankumensis]SHI41871.1 General stress protein 26 [Wenxinia saemankumensis]